MSNTSGLESQLDFLRKFWKNKVSARKLLNSENYIFVRDFGPGHFYSPIPDLAELRRNSERIFDQSIRELPAIDLNESWQLNLLNAFARTYSELPFPEKQAPEFRYFFDNSFFSYGDGIILYCFLRQFKPKRVIEVGSGFSSAEMLDVSDRFFGKQIEFTFIEPYPERLRSLFSKEDEKNCRIEIKPVQKVESSAFTVLEESDFLFVDSSHVGKTHSDVLHILFNVLPLLKKGVIIHFHDILWPFEYPQSWLEEGRAWNEAYFLRAFLQNNPSYEILYFNSFMEIHHAELLGKAMPLALKRPSTPETVGNSSLWLRKV